MLKVLAGSVRYKARNLGMNISHGRREIAFCPAGCFSEPPCTWCGNGWPKYESAIEDEVCLWVARGGSVGAPTSVRDVVSWWWCCRTMVVMATGVDCAASAVTTQQFNIVRAAGRREAAPLLLCVRHVVSLS